MVWPRDGVTFRVFSGPIIYAEEQKRVFRIAQDGDTVTFATGRYLDRVVQDDAALRFKSRRVVLDSRRVDILLVLPL